MIKPLDSSLRWNDDEEEKSLVAIPIARLSFLAIAPSPSLLDSGFRRAAPGILGGSFQTFLRQAGIALPPTSF